MPHSLHTNAPSMMSKSLPPQTKHSFCISRIDFGLETDAQRATPTSLDSARIQSKTASATHEAVCVRRPGEMVDDDDDDDDVGRTGFRTVLRPSDRRQQKRSNEPPATADNHVLIRNGRVARPQRDNDIIPTSASRHGFVIYFRRSHLAQPDRS